MLPILKIFVSCLVIRVGLVKSQHSTIPLIIKDFVAFQNGPLKMFAFVCWTEDDLLNFQRIMHRNYITVAILTNKNLKLPYGHPEEHYLYFLDLNCIFSKKLLEQANELELFRSPFQWLVYGKNDFESIYIGVDSRFFLLTEVQRDTFSIKSFYKYNRDLKKHVVQDVALWSGTTGFVYFNSLSAFRNRSDLKGTSLNISYVLTNPDTLNHLHDYRKTQTDPIIKVINTWLLHLQSLLNATRVFSLEKIWGIPIKQNPVIYNGLIGAIQQRKVDIGSPIFMMAERVAILEYLETTTPTFLRFIFRDPPLSYISNIFVHPFDKWLWISILLVVTLTTIAIYLLLQLEQKYLNKIMKPQEKLSFLDVVLMKISTITQQGSNDVPRNLSVRIALIFVFFSWIFVYTSYSANIVALLQSSARSIHTLRDLLDSGLELGVENVPYAYQFLVNPPDSVRKAISKKIFPDKVGTGPNILPLREGVRKIEMGFYALHTEASTAYKLIGEMFLENEKCGLQEIEYWSQREPYIPVKKNSTYKELLKIGFRMIKETGIGNREIRRVYTKKPICTSRGNNFVSVGLIDSYFAFAIYIGGTLLALVILLVERTVQWKKIKIKNNKISKVVKVKTNNSFRYHQEHKHINYYDG